MTKYRKTALIDAEQFFPPSMIPAGVISNGNGDPRVDARYDFVVHAKEGLLYPKSGDWIATGVDGEHWVIDDDIFKRTYVAVAPAQAGGEAVEAMWDAFIRVGFPLSFPDMKDKRMLAAKRLADQRRDADWEQALRLEESLEGCKHIIERVRARLAGKEWA